MGFYFYLCCFRRGFNAPKPPTPTKQKSKVFIAKDLK
ncbi:hypothetical protein HPPC_05750 [Helicobacter pylori PeCan4]|nr:hypothetical protein HPPC_05750 [Helicobacter pylori PeCan4]